MIKDHCVLCGVETPYNYETPVDMRIGYVEGAGQLCSSCFDRTNTTYDHLEHILVSVYTIKSTSNDQELGARVRQLYWENKK